MDVFSFSESKPYRIDFFGDEVDSIRRFNISSQLRPTNSTGWRSFPTSMPAMGRRRCRSCSSRVLRQPAGSTMPTTCCAVSTTCAARCSRTWRSPGRSTAC
ncbi:MAG: hypothetical protein ACLRMJ_01240 [Alistipes finegoldii]